MTFRALPRGDDARPPGRRLSPGCGFCLLMVLVSVVRGVQAAADPDGRPDERILVVGVLAHDRGPSSDEFEQGTDLNVEVQFLPLYDEYLFKYGAPRPHFGANVNFDGETSFVYGGLTYTLDFSHRFFASVAGGIAVHNGALHKDDEERCREESDCGFGTPLLPRIALEAGMRIGGKQAITLFYDHMSHFEILADENEGIDHVGIRYHLRF
jgi:lipid A 3-O-deacylase